MRILADEIAAEAQDSIDVSKRLEGSTLGGKRVYCISGWRIDSLPRRRIPGVSSTWSDPPAVVDTSFQEARSHTHLGWRHIIHTRMQYIVMY